MALGSTRRLLVVAACVLGAAVCRAQSSPADDPPLIAAAKNGQLSRVGELLKGGADPSLKDQYGYTAMMWALTRGSLSMVQALLNAGAVIPSDGPGFVALIQAAKHGDADTVSFLLKRNAAIDARDQSGRTALMWAAAKDDAATARVLLAARADASLTNAEGQTALILAAQAGFSDLIPALISPASRDLQDNFGYTALMWAAHNRRVDAVRVLVAAGANRALKAKDGMTAADIAAQRGYPDVLASL